MLGKWREKRARVRQDREHREAEIERQAIAIFEEIAEPLAADGLATIKRSVLPAGPASGADRQWIEMQPTRDGAASVAISPIGVGWCDFTVGQSQVNAEFDTSKDGWQDELAAWIRAVAEGRYRERVYRSRFGGPRHEMVFELPDGDRRSLRFGSTYGPEHDTRPLPYRN